MVQKKHLSLGLWAEDREEECLQQRMVTRPFAGPCFYTWLFCQRQDITEGECYRPFGQAEEVDDGFEQGIGL